MERREREAAHAALLRFLVATPAAALAAWSQSVLPVPFGHRSPGIRWCSRSSACLIRDALEHREARLCLGQQNAKSAIVAVCLLARLVGLLRVSGWLGGVCSINKGKAAELKEQMEMIAIASGLRDLEFRRSPASGRVTLNAAAHPSATRLASMTPWSMSWGCWPSAPDPWRTA